MAQPRRTLGKPQRRQIGVRRPRQRSRAARFGRRLLRVVTWSGWLTLAQLLTAIATVAALLFTAQSLRATQSQISITEQGQLTERFGKAIEQLGSDKPDIRLGGIYALERLARDSSRDHPTIMEVLTAYIRRSAPTPCPPPTTTNGDLPRLESTAQAALTVIGRRNTNFDADRSLNLTRTCLVGADLANADLANADLYRADLAGAFLANADLANADLYRADLVGAYLAGANLAGAYLAGANLACANLRCATLRETNLAGAHLSGASLTGAHLDRANLTGADLAGANLTEAFVVGADLVRANLTGTNLAGANLAAADLAGADLTSASLRDADLRNANLNGTILSGADLTGVRGYP